MRSCDISNQTGVLSHILILILNFPKRNQSTSTVLCQQNYTGLNLKKVATTTTAKKKNDLLYCRNVLRQPLFWRVGGWSIKQIMDERNCKNKNIVFSVQLGAALLSGYPLTSTTASFVITVPM